MKQNSIRVVAVAALASISLLAAACAQPSGGGTPPTVTQVPNHGGFQMVANGSRGFYGMPYPNEIRKLENGTIDLRGLPGASNNILNGDPVPTVPFLQASVALAAQTVTDFGRNTAVYFQANRVLDEATFPSSAVDSVLPGSSVMLIDIDNGNVAHPVLTEYEVTGDRFTLSKTLTILPYPGQPLKADTDYAAVIFTGVETAAGDPVEPAPLVSQLDMPWDDTHGVTEAEWAELQSQRDRVRGAVNATTTWAEADIAAFTVFHTQDTDRELDSITSTLATLPAPTLTVTSQGACAVDATVGGNGATNSLIEGTLGMPDFQKGAYPFLQSGGFMEFAVDDKAIVQRTTDVPVRLRVPCGASPAAGWPSIGHVGAIDALGDSDTFAPPYQYGGYVFAEIPAHMAGATSTTLTGVNVPVSQQPGLLYANFVNPAAGRINPLQQASNHISLRSFLDTFTVDGTTVGTTGTVGTDPAASAVSGHSQGAATLPFVAKGAPGVEGAFSSSGSGAQYHSLAHTGQRNSLALFTGEDEPLDELNPLIQLVQTTTEASDAINVEAAGLPAGLHYVNVTGQNDGCVAAEASRHFATAMGLGLVNRQFPASFYGDPVFDPATATLPAAANGPGGATRLQIEGWGDHAEASANPHLGTNFLTYIAAGVAPQVDPYTHSSTYGVCGYRYDYLGGDPFGRV